MFSYLIGQITEKTPARCTLEIHGVGYDISIPFSTSEIITLGQHDVKLFTFVHVREDILQIYGFATEKERAIFEELISVSGIGPKSALGILSGITSDELRSRIVNEDVGGLVVLPGIGKKTAERMIVELRDKFIQAGIQSSGVDIPVKPNDEPVIEDAISALVSLGYPKSAASKSIQKVAKKMDEEFSVEILVRKALQSL